MASSTSSQTTGGPSKAIGVGKTGPWGKTGSSGKNQFTPIKYKPMSGQYSG